MRTARGLLTLSMLGWPLAAAGLAAPASEPPRTDLPPEARQFDFWLGAWDVNLRIRQEDGSWPDRVAAEARIYPVLDGKAVLELWDSEPIVGFSLRYFDPAEEAWVLWLNWPGKNRSGGSELTGGFRHGRGDFRSVRRQEDGSELISRYSFNDITPTTLRWDDAYSTDGGETWRHNWIMEFTRTAEVAPSLPREGGVAHTWRTGDRCDEEPFRRFETLAGAREGVFERRGEGGGWSSAPAELVSYRILDGCATLTFLRTTGGDEPWESVHLQTWNTYASVHEESVLDRRPGSPLRVLYGAAEGSTVVLDGGPRGEAERAVRHRWTIGDGGARLEVQALEDGVWQAVAKARFPTSR